jgi:plasmid stability protein
MVPGSRAWGEGCSASGDLQQRAREHRRSMEAEVHVILAAALTRVNLAHARIVTTLHRRGDDVQLPE